ncbi:hypothetical protein HBI79_100440 [Parastagonospora nodorum]|nr:hypothetical protein HBI79_100440 [Parastagonospora nodorum]KAH4982446.1 hypothetical protein HBI76_158150 [Parastagonospora nodorum]
MAARRELLSVSSVTVEKPSMHSHLDINSDNIVASSAAGPMFPERSHIVVLTERFDGEGKERSGAVGVFMSSAIRSPVKLGQYLTWLTGRGKMQLPLLHGPADLFKVPY